MCFHINIYLGLLMAMHRNVYKKARIQHRKLVRMTTAQEAKVRDENLISDPGATYRRIKSVKWCTAGKIHKLTVGYSVSDTSIFNPISIISNGYEDTESHLDFHFAAHTLLNMHLKAKVSIQFALAKERLESVTWP